jgi:hypothetical protein
MEESLARRTDERTRALLAAYAELVPRFAEDLGDERDELLSRGGALMLVQALASRPG